MVIIPAVKWHAVPFDCPNCGVSPETIAEVCISADFCLALRGYCPSCGEFFIEMKIQQLVDSCEAVDRAARCVLKEMLTFGVH